MEPKKDYYNATQDAIFDAVALCLGLDEAGANAMIRFTTPSGLSQSFEELKPEENRCYIRMGTTPLGGAWGRDRVYQHVNSGDELIDKTVTVMDGLSAMLMFYGPKASTNAERVGVMIMEDEVRHRLLADELAPVDLGTAPVWIPELVNGNWVSRCDLELRFYRLMEYQSKVQAIEELPDIVIRRDR